MSFCVACVGLALMVCDSSDKYEELGWGWGGGLWGNKSTQMLCKRAKAAGQTVSAAALGKL